MFRSIRNVGRLVGLARILARHDALFSLEMLGVHPGILGLAKFGIGGMERSGRPGQRLTRALNEAGPSFIKLGQALSTRSDLLGEELASDLSELQDSLPPFSAAQAREALINAFGTEPETLFAEFDGDAIAAASIAQVHFAKTPDGREVAVKILRPGIEQAFRRDLDLLLWLAEVAERARPELRRLKPVQSVETIAEAVELEMDLRFEAAAAAELAENFADDPDFVVPEVDWTRTAKRVLTTARLTDGIPMDDRDAIVAAGHDPESVITKAAAASFRQVFRDGFFHADTHPGNMFVLPSGAIGVVDFGIMGRLNLKTRRNLAEMLVAFLNRNYRRAAEVHFEAGWVPADRSVDSFTQACRSIAEPILDKPQGEISIARLLAQLFQITETFRMEARPELLLLQKTMLVAEGTARKLCPEANMWLLIRPLIEDWMVENLGAEAKIKDAVETLRAAVERLPGVLGGIEQSSRLLAEGRIKLHPDTISALRNGGQPGRRSVPMIWLIVFGLFFAYIAIVLR
ncbi:MAG: 2-polyprenylphenol 6-hydroxylase [Proteobacteria bacterium]|nr:2-polyprenylphenol 6-hydroxylase [Pseudomonadota bacterium]